MKFIRFIALLLVVVGAINWGLWGFFQYDLVADFLGGNAAPLARLVYALIGIAGLYSIVFFFIPAIYKARCSCMGKHICGTCKEEKKD